MQRVDVSEAVLLMRLKQFRRLWYFSPELQAAAFENTSAPGTQSPGILDPTHVEMKSFNG